MTTTISTNNRRLLLLSWRDLPEDAREQFDTPPEDEQYSERFFKAYGQYWNLYEFQRIEKRSQTTIVPMGWSFSVDDDSPLLKWHGICTTSFGGGVLVRQVPDDDEHVVAGWVILS